MSNSYHANPWRAEYGARWWLLCHPSPIPSTPSTALFRLPSPVSNRCRPHRCPTELTANVIWKISTVLRQYPQTRPDHPPSR